MTTSSEDATSFRPANTSNVIVGAVFLVGALFFIFYMVPHHIQEAPLVKNPMMSPRWLPGIAGWLTAIFSLLLILEGLFGQKAEHDKSQDGGPALRWMLMIVALAVYFFLFEWVGAIITGVLATVILFAAHPIRQWLVYILALVFPVAVVFFFIQVLDVPLPLLFLS
nr:tripartite tricarboxylate transporter TctB family protein [uncultured Halomonas sp.]